MSTRPRLTVVYPGSFDPVTLGHEDVARRALRLADHLVIAVAHSASQTKQGMFTVEERVALLKEVFADEERIECVSFKGLLVEFARERGATLMIRGLRAVSDFEYEFQMAQMNRELHHEMDTVFLIPDARHAFLSASLVREVAALGGDVTPFVSPNVLARMKAKLAR
jgi:pantetheine-phosphate adenylyltransferase